LVILTHGELLAALTLQRLLEERLGFSVVVADHNQVFELEGAG
jgi:hypothetical protein